ncbi:MAG: hypothetical protein HQM08_17040 [Candidatus Riflebacteria bacterium]|nr:hypothetical protein [Candidatus Riflebacteria bacterium]
MALQPVSTEIIDKIRQALGLDIFNRPHGILADPGDWGTVVTYLPLSSAEFKKLPLDLQRHVYVIGSGRYGLIGYVPKKFNLPPKTEIKAVSAVYDDFGRLIELTYKVDEKGPEYSVTESHRRDQLLETAKKKKISVKTVIRSRK